MCCALGLKNKQNTTYIQGLGPRVIDPWWVPQVQDSLSECSHADYLRPATVYASTLGGLCGHPLPILVMNVSSSKASTTSMVTFRTCVGSIFMQPPDQLWDLDAVSLLQLCFEGDFFC